MFRVLFILLIFLITLSLQIALLVVFAGSIWNLVLDEYSIESCIILAGNTILFVFGGYALSSIRRFV